jgi:uncharacterized protein YciI
MERYEELRATPERDFVRHLTDDDGFFTADQAASGTLGLEHDVIELTFDDVQDSPHTELRAVLRQQSLRHGSLVEDRRAFVFHIAGGHLCTVALRTLDLHSDATRATFLGEHPGSRHERGLVPHVLRVTAVDDGDPGADSIVAHRRDLPEHGRIFACREVVAPRDATKDHPSVHYLLFYDVVPDYAERRKPLRAAHLDHANAAIARGELVLGGALADPAEGAMLLFRAASPAVAEAFAKNDPYVTNGLVTSYRVRRWVTVVGALAEEALPPPAEASPRAKV